MTGAFHSGGEIDLTGIGGTFFATVSLPDDVKCTLAVLAPAYLSKPVWQSSCTVQRSADRHSAKTAHPRNRHSQYVRFAPKLKGTYE